MQTGLASNAIAALTSIITVRRVDRNEFGLFAIALSVVEIGLLFQAGYSQAIGKFLRKQIPLEDKQKILGFVFYYKYMVLILLGAGIAVAYQFGLLEGMVHGGVGDLNFGLFLSLGVLATFASQGLGISIEISNAMEQYDWVRNVTIAGATASLLLVFVATSFTDSYAAVIGLSMAVTVLQSIVINVLIQRKYPQYSIFSYFKFFPSRITYNIFLRSYSTPLTLTSLMTYTKTQLPTLVLGSTLGVGEAATYTVFRRIFKYLHVLANSYLDSLIGKLVAMKDANHDKFRTLFNRLYHGGFLSSVTILAVVFTSSDWILWLFEIPKSNETHFLLLLFGAEFLCATIIEYSIGLLRTGENTMPIFYMSCVRAIIEIVLLFLLIPHFGVAGAAFTAAFSRLIQSILGQHLVGKFGVLRLRFLPVAISSVVLVIATALKLTNG